jgi:hypothetical protein
LSVTSCLATKALNTRFGTPIKAGILKETVLSAIKLHEATIRPICRNSSKSAVIKGFIKYHDEKHYCNWWISADCIVLARGILANWYICSTAPVTHL